MDNIAVSPEKSREKGAGWLRLHRKKEALDLLLRHHVALALLTLLALRARYHPGIDSATGIELQVGEALTGRGDAVKIHTTDKKYRIARAKLIKWGFLTITTATSGATRGTVVKLTNTAIYEVAPIQEGQVVGHVRLHRKKESLDLLLRHHVALALLTLLALRARYYPGIDLTTGKELQFGEALTRRGDDAERIGASPHQYRIARDKLIKWDFLTTSTATSGATSGTVVKLTNTCCYEVVPYQDGQVEGQVEGHQGATMGPPEGHEQRTEDPQEQNTTPPTPPTDEPGGGGDEQEKEIQDYIRLILDRDTLKAVRPGSYRAASIKRLEKQGWILCDRDLADLAAARIKEEELKKYALFKASFGEVASSETPQKISSAAWEKARLLIQEKLKVADFEMWIGPLQCVYDDVQVIKLAGPDPYFCNWVRENYLTQIQEALPGRDVNLIVRGGMQ